MSSESGIPSDRSTTPSKVSARSGQALTKRLQNELMSLSMNPENGISAFPEGDSLFRWIGTIKGPENTVYDGLEYKLVFVFDSEYPYKPPTVTFKTPCYHPNVNTLGTICLDILQDKWSAMLDIRTILISIRSLLGEPNVNSPLNNSAAALWKHPDQYKQALLAHYHREVRSVRTTASSTQSQ